jgi:[acyl-carrier-protein] S-malonyltransferase
MLVSPSKGTFHQADGVGMDTALTAGVTVGEVTNLRGSTPVVAPHGGTVVEWIVEDGDLVSPGQPLVRLHPESE